MSESESDPLARVERIASAQRRLERDLKRERERSDRLFDPAHVPAPELEVLARRILGRLEPLIHAEAQRLEPRFRELVASDAWKRLRKLSRSLERTSDVLLPTMVVSLPSERAFLETEAPGGLASSGSYRWVIRSGRLELTWHIPAGWFGCSATFATYDSFRDLSVVALRSRDITETAGPLVEVMTSKARPVFVSRLQAHAIVALATARLLELLERGEIVARCARVLSAGREDDVVER